MSARPQPLSLSGWSGAAPHGRSKSTPRVPNRMRPAAERHEEIDPMQRSLNPVSRLHQDEVQFRIILASTYPFFLAAALVQRVVPQERSAMPQQRRSVFAEARAMAVSAIPFVFMG
jgi:hypothetical protein